VGAASVGAASVGAASVGSAAVGAASVGSAAVGAAPVGAASVKAAAAAGTRSGRTSVGGLAAPERADAPGGKSRTGAASVPPRGEDRAAARVRAGAAPVVGAKAGAAKAAGLKAGASAKATESSGGLRGAGEELRNRMRTQRRLRVVTLLSLAVVVLVVLPAIFGLRTATKDPVFSSLDALEVPSWAATKVVDQGSGSRWCFLECRFRERIAQSDKAFPETTQTYTNALRSAGWQPWKVGECPETPIAADQGTYSCWKRDEFTLDLWVRLPECAVDQIAAQDPAAATLPSAPPTPSTKKCVGSTVSIKVQNALIDSRGKPETADRPLVGETPDPVLSNDPLLVPTPTAS
jgi:integrin beta 3